MPNEIAAATDASLATAPRRDRTAIAPIGATTLASTRRRVVRHQVVPRYKSALDKGWEAVKARWSAPSAEGGTGVGSVTNRSRSHDRGRCDAASLRCFRGAVALLRRRCDEDAAALLRQRRDRGAAALLRLRCDGGALSAASTAPLRISPLRPSLRPPFRPSAASGIGGRCRT